MGDGARDPVVVCGAGAAGMASAISAARAGADVRLIEARDDVGGTMADALLHTLAGLYDSAGEYQNGGLAAEMAERLLAADRSVKKRKMGRIWVLSVDPNLYREVVREWLAAEPRIVVERETQVTRVERRGVEVVAVELRGPAGSHSVASRAVVDATGYGDVVSLIDSSLVDRAGEVAAGGWIFRLRPVGTGALSFPKGAAIVRALRDAAASGALPRACEHAWVDVGIHDDEAFVKLLVPLDVDWRDREARGEISGAARATQDQVFAFLRALPGFERAAVSQTGRLGVRDGGRVRGQYQLTKADVLALRRFDDAACRCSWPIEYWDSSAGVSLEYLPSGAYYEIPLRSLAVATLSNVWVAGKSLCADAHARASARCVGTCWAMGETVGRAAASFPATGEGGAR